jgi:hypothetical protein
LIQNVAERIKIVLFQCAAQFRRQLHDFLDLAELILVRHVAPLFGQN